MQAASSGHAMNAKVSLIPLPPASLGSAASESDTLDLDSGAWTDVAT